MFINVEDAPGNIKLQIPIFVALGGLLCGPLDLDGSLDQGFWIAAGVDLQLDKAFGLDPKVVKIVPFGDDTFTNNQDPALYFSEWAASPQTIISSRHHRQPDSSRTRPNE
jgi:hypothetical protein